MSARMAAARSVHERRTAAGFLAQTENKRHVSGLSVSGVLQDKNALDREPVKDRRSDKSRDHLLKCKERPDPKESRRSGIGGGNIQKKFVPWCK